MVGRIFKGDWNAALFDHENGSRLHHQNVGFHISASTFTPDGKTLYLAGGANQGNPEEEKIGAALCSTMYLNLVWRPSRNAPPEIALSQCPADGDFLTT